MTDLSVIAEVVPGVGPGLLKLAADVDVGMVAGLFIIHAVSIGDAAGQFAGSNSSFICFFDKSVSIPFGRGAMAILGLKSSS
jgi:hypothetical protein